MDSSPQEPEKEVVKMEEKKGEDSEGKEEKKSKKVKKPAAGKDALLKAQIDYVMGAGMEDEEKQRKIKEIEEDETNANLWTWLHERGHDDMHILMSLHKSTRKKWNSAFDLYEDPHKKGSDKTFKETDCYVRAHFWLAVYWASKGNFNSWESDGEVESKLRKYYKKNQTTKSGGQGIKKLQRKFWQRKYPNLFPQDTDTVKTPKVAKTPKGKRKAEIIVDE